MNIMNIFKSFIGLIKLEFLILILTSITGNYVATIISTIIALCSAAWIDIVVSAVKPPIKI